jgi:raffinose/stachyose/melibiose transport system permease protein
VAIDGFLIDIVVTTLIPALTFSALPWAVFTIFYRRPGVFSDLRPASIAFLIPVASSIGMVTTISALTSFYENRTLASLAASFSIILAIGGVILGVIWQFIFNTALVSISDKFNLPFFSQSWISDTNKAFWALIIVTVWQSSGYMMIIYITGLISIEQDVLEAAKVDGASPLRMLTAIKVPLMAQSFTIALFLTMRSGFMAYDVNLALTGGGPYRTTELISMHIFQEAFAFGHFGTGQAKAVLMFLMVAAAALIQVVVSKRAEVQQ